MYSIYLDVIAKRDYVYRQLSDIPVEELEDFFMSHLEKTGDKKFNFGELILQPSYSDTYMALGAFDIIREKKGDDYALNLLGFRKTKTMIEKVPNFITASYPKL